MIIELVLKLLDRLIDLAKRREEVNHSLFLNLVQPAFNAFESVHADYIESLMRYNAQLSDKTVALDLNHPVFDQIDLDSLKSEHLRTKLRDFKPKESSPKLQNFLTAIDFYLRGLSSIGDHIDILEQILARHNPRYEDLKSLAVIKSPVQKLPPTSSDFLGPPIVSDPMRLALRQLLVGFDAPWPESEEEDINQLIQSQMHVHFANDENRRQNCAYAIQETISALQHSYSRVSAEYSTLRAEMMI